MIWGIAGGGSRDAPCKDRMARRLTNALTDRKVKAAKAKLKPYRLYDGSGLYLEVSPAGGNF